MREIKLKWYESRRCWRVRRTINNKTRDFYCGKGATGSDDQLARARALLEAESGIRQAKADAKAKAEERVEDLILIDNISRMANEANEAAAFFQRPFEVYLSEMVSGNHEMPKIIQKAFDSGIRAENAEAENERLRARLAETEAMLSAQGRAAIARSVANLSELGEVYLGVEEAALEVAGRTKNHVGSLRTNLTPLVNYLLGKGIQTTADLDAHEHVLGEYRHDLIRQKQNEKKSCSWLKGRLRVTHLFVEWLLQRAYLAEMPRSIGRTWAKTGSDAPSPTFLTDEECRQVFSTGNDRLKLAVALGLNCGYRAADIRTLMREHVFIREKEIVRQRSKTGTAQRHKLWRVTADLLETHLAKNNEPFAEGWSNISKEVTELIDSVLPGNSEAEGKNRRTAKSLRSTGAQAIEQATGGNSPHVVSQWLAHGEKKTAKHYRIEELTPMYRAIEQTEKLFALR